MNNQIKVFLSSTFEDMQNEREHLVKKIFPAIKAECERRDVEFSVVDLRWGISDEKPGKIIDVCLKEIDSSRPFFIGLVGERYGTMWSREDFSDDEMILRDRPCVEDYMKDGMSITEMEMQYGVFDKTDDVNALFYIKKSKWYRRKGETRGTKEERLLKQKKLGKLIDKIDDFAEQGKVKAERYSSTSQLGATVYRQMMEMLDKQYPVINDDNEMFHLARTQKAWMRELCKIYYGDENVETVESLLDGSYTLPYGVGYSGDILCKHVSISGKQGAGKSALLANLCNGKKNFFYIRACNEVSDGIQLLELLKHMVEGEELDFANDTIFCAIDDSEKLMVDAKNFEFWLRDRLPENIRVIYSRSGYYDPKEDRCDRLTFLKENYKKYVWDYEVKDLSADEVSRFIEDILQISAKELIARKKAHIGNNPLFHTPGMLKLLLNEMVQYGSYERIDDFTDKYLLCKDRTEFFDCILQRMEEDYGKETVRRLMGMLALIPIGLPSDDLRDYLHVTHMEWAVLNEVLSEFLTLLSGMLVLDSNDMRNAVLSRYMSDTAFVNDLRRDAIKLLRKERKRREPKLWDKSIKIINIQKILLSIIIPVSRYENNDFIYKRVNDVLAELYILLDMKKELRSEYLRNTKYLACCSPNFIEKLRYYVSTDLDMFAEHFTSRFILLGLIRNGKVAFGRMFSKLSREQKNIIIKKLQSLWMMPKSLKNEIVDNIEASNFDSIDYFSPNCNFIALRDFVIDLLFVDDDSLSVTYDKVKNLLASNKVLHGNFPCLYNLMAAYCYYRLESRYGENPYYNKAVELDFTGTTVSQTLYPFLIESREDYESLLKNLRNNVTLLGQNSIQRINAAIHLAQAEFLDAITSSDNPKIQVSDAPDEVLTTDEKWRIPVEQLFVKHDVTIAGYNRYDLACQFAKLANIKGEYYWGAAWAHSFAYKFAQSSDERITCLQNIQTILAEDSTFDLHHKGKPLTILILDKLLELHHRDDAHPLFEFFTILAKVDAYKRKQMFQEAIKVADDAYAFFDARRDSIGYEALGEQSYAKALYSIWVKQPNRCGIKYLLDKAYIHFDKAINLYREKERDWYIACENRNNVIVEMCRNYGVIPKGQSFDSVLSGYREFLLELRTISVDHYNICLKNYCFLLLRAGRTEEVLRIVKENSTCDLYLDDALAILRKQGHVKRCEVLMSNALYEGILNGLSCYSNRSNHNKVVITNHNLVYTEFPSLRDYKGQINGGLYFTFHMLVEYAKKNKPIKAPRYENKQQKLQINWDWQVARHTILLLNAMWLEDASEQEKAYNEAIQYIVSLYKECKRKITFSFAPIFPMLMLMSKIKLKEQHQNRPVDALIWFKDVYKTLVEETGEESDYIEWDLTFPFISLQSFLDDDSSKFGGLKHLCDIMARSNDDLHLCRRFRDLILIQWNKEMDDSVFNTEVYKKYAYRFIDLHKETSFLNDGIFEKLIKILIDEESKDELIHVVDYFVNNGACYIVATSLSHITAAMLRWGEEERLLAWLDTLWKDYHKCFENHKDDEYFRRFPFVQISYAKVRTLCHMDRYEEAYQFATKNRKEFEYISACIDISDRRFMSWEFYFCAGIAAMLSEQLHEAMDFLKKDSEIINKIQEAINNPEPNSGYYGKPEEAFYTQDEIDAYRIDNGCMMATCMLKQGNIEDGKRHFAEHVEPLLSDADADNDNVKFYQETLSKLA